MPTSCLDIVLFLCLEWSQVHRKGTSQTFNCNVWFDVNSSKVSNLKDSLMLRRFCVPGGILHCHISICDVGGVAGSGSYITGSQRGHYVLPLPRSVTPCWPRGIDSAGAVIVIEISLLRFTFMYYSLVFHVFLVWNLNDARLTKFLQCKRAGRDPSGRQNRCNDDNTIVLDMVESRPWKHFTPCFVLIKC